MGRSTYLPWLVGIKVGLYLLINLLHSRYIGEILDDTAAILDDSLDDGLHVGPVDASDWELLDSHSCRGSLCWCYNTMEFRILSGLMASYLLW